MNSVGILSRMQCRRLVGVRPFSSSPHARLLSTSSYQRIRPLPRPSAFAPSAKRNLWLFSSKPSAPTPPPPPPQPSISELTFEQAPPEAVVPAHATSGFSDAFPADSTVLLDSDLSAPIAASSSISDTLISIAPLQYGDLAALGLAHWTPSGICQWMLEIINVSTGMPWFYTIVAGTVLSRVLLLPFSIQQLRNSARLAPYQGHLMQIKDEMNRSRETRDPLAMQKVALKQRKVYEEAGVSMLPMLATPFVQLPVTLGMFFAVKGLCTLPLQQLMWSGVSFLPDLTVAEPYYILPIAAAVCMNAQLTLGASDFAGDRQTMAHMINFFRVISVFSIPVMGAFPAGLNLYVLTGVIAMLLQTVVLRSSAVRRFLNIPVAPKSAGFKPVTFMESINHLKKYFQEQSEMAQKKAAEKRKW